MMPYKRVRKYCQDPGYNLALARRMKNERQRLVIKAPEAADICIVSVVTVRNYERGTSLPDALALDRLYRRGMDIGYVVTGVRHIRSQEKADQLVLELFRALAPAAKNKFLDYAYDLFKTELFAGRVKENQELEEQLVFLEKAAR